MDNPHVSPSRVRLHNALEVSLAIKGLMALTETASGAALMFIGSARVGRFVDWLVNNNLAVDPADRLGTFVRQVADSLSLDTHNFFAWYLISQGAVKLCIIIALARGVKWFYPIGAAILSAFVGYQIYHIWIDASAVLLVLTMFDIVVVTLVLREYRALEAEG